MNSVIKTVEKWKKIRELTLKILSACKQNDGKLIVVDFKTRKILKTFQLIEGKNEE